MRILIDECLDWRLCRALINHHCSSVRAEGWTGLTNGKLLENAQHQFDVFLTADRNLRFQQNLETFDIAVVVLEAVSNRLIDTLQLMPQAQTIVEMIQPGQVVCIRHSS